MKLDHAEQAKPSDSVLTSVGLGMCAVFGALIFLVVVLANRNADPTPYFERNYAVSCQDNEDVLKVNYVWRGQPVTVTLDDSEFYGDVIARGKGPRNGVPLDTIWFLDIQRVAPNAQFDREFFQVMNDRNNAHLMMDRPCLLEFLQRMPESVQLQGYKALGEAATPALR